jgi:hypothetical protein
MLRVAMGRARPDVTWGTRPQALTDLEFHGNTSTNPETLGRDVPSNWDTAVNVNISCSRNSREAGIEERTSSSHGEEDNSVERQGMEKV